MSEGERDDPAAAENESKASEPSPQPVKGEPRGPAGAQIGGSWTLIDPEGRILMFASEDELRASLTPPVPPVAPATHIAPVATASAREADEAETKPTPPVALRHDPADEPDREPGDDDETAPLSVRDVILVTPGPMPIAPPVAADASDAESPEEGPARSATEDEKVDEAPTASARERAEEEETQPLSMRDVIAVAPAVSMPPPVPPKRSKAPPPDDGPPPEDKPLGQLLNAANAPLTPERILAATSIAPPAPAGGAADVKIPKTKSEEKIALPQKGELKPTPTVRESTPPASKKAKGDDDAPRSSKSGGAAKKKKKRPSAAGEERESRAPAKASAQPEEASGGQGWKIAAALAAAVFCVWYFGIREEAKAPTEPTPTATTTTEPTATPSSSATAATSSASEAPSASAAGSASESPSAVASVAPPTSAAKPAGSGGTTTATTGEAKDKPIMSMADLLVAASKAKHSGDRAKAKAMYERVLNESGPNVEAWSGLGDIARQEGQLGVAKARYQNALGMSPGYFPALMGLADTQWELGEQTAARALYTQLMQRNPNAPARVRERATGGSGTAPATTSTGTATTPTATAPTATTAPPDPSP
ncbi:MAG: tetratricopeptide repeat protein [Polyangiaceae bacterium]